LQVCVIHRLDGLESDIEVAAACYNEVEVLSMIDERCELFAWKEEDRRTTVSSELGIDKRGNMVSHPSV
jgi:hypothetical protein